jgi:hypothetical protein
MVLFWIGEYATSLVQLCFMVVGGLKVLWASVRVEG